ncbi:enoyl-CoA hydratase/isomerase family protein [Halomonas sp. MCCC 1A17488]|uniref:Enoyl-CoA hydratase/isomerase family protein n=1 Tax=Billgrantia sulfidoxydans TaxID=2733484 RepID=A0ABX7W4D3_9GAMM|nr:MULTISPECIES: enoyl-CoA hydratase/isomerase family protein [Halomonas]MCE8015194.1 enoyl-CoA hydratase/isomerase family protein [Halomonas sp. MCCC 1A17488]MCG3238527.1 enoyl-CoA hydratase/isomerase family protein [Halomonas sp. MCCC 1A17488]QPP47733.1 enoyl-CoA hydratase/isomerase family protein [Halomonas sp. SS10-MC5]QTP55040.1 enoyl-CoA hydratase/isomerase family protein [Halomonas sulfidoxydans]
MTSPVTYQRHDEIGVIIIDNPPVNALGQAVRQGVMEAVSQGNDDPQAQVLVLLARGRTFIAGADIREFGKPPQAPILPQVIAHLEASAKPIVAVLHGTALGGGLEVAMGCQLRVALPGTRVGLPEVKLGLLPGAGGTQRLPRLAGVEAALDLITSGRFAPADEALSLGIVDAVLELDDPLEAGLAAARDVLSGTRRARVTGELPPPAADPEVIERYRAKLESEVPELYSPFRCLEAIAASSEGSLAEGLRRERELFLSCMESPQRAGLIHAFFAARAPHKVPEAGEASALTRLALLGEHPLYDKLRNKAERAGIELNERADDATQACLIAAGADATCPAHCLRIALRDVEAAHDLDSLDADLALVVPAEGSLAELVALRADAARQQAVANLLKALRQEVAVSRQGSLLATLAQAAWDDDANPHAAMEAASLMLAERGWAYRASDIDLLAIEALGYPRHLGGPHRQASLAVEERHG